MDSRTFISAVGAAALALSVSACGNMDRQQLGTGTGAVLGGAAGNAVTGGSTAGTIGGAAAGGVLGSEVTRDR